MHFVYPPSRHHYQRLCRARRWSCVAFLWLLSGCSTVAPVSADATALHHDDTALAEQTYIDSRACYTHWSPARLKSLATRQFAVSASEQAELWQALRHCLAEPDASIRDDVAFAAYSHWLRQGLASQAQQRWLLTQLQTDLNQGVDDKAQVYRPFAILTLSELIRADRVRPYLSAAQRQQLVDTVCAFLARLTDRRGFSAEVGWRHGTAHAADAVLQLALNPAVSATQLAALRQALVGHVAPLDHAYRYGEPGRLARAFVYLQQRHELTDWSTWWARQIAPPTTDVTRLYQQETGLVYLHNSRAFWLELAYQASSLQNAAATQATAIERLAAL